MRKVLLAAVVISFVTPASASAQETQAPQSPGVIVVSSQKCHFSKTAEMNKWMRETAAPVLNDLVTQGKLVSWGVLDHAWGDEWNNLTYYSAKDLNTFTTAFSEYFRRIMQSDPGIMQKFESWCTEHKDNIYSVVMTNATTRP